MEENNEYCWYSLMINGKWFEIKHVDIDKDINITVSYIFKE